MTELLLGIISGIISGILLSVATWYIRYHTYCPRVAVSDDICLKICEEEREIRDKKTGSMVRRKVRASVYIIK